MLGKRVIFGFEKSERTDLGHFDHVGRLPSPETQIPLWAEYINWNAWYLDETNVIHTDMFSMCSSQKPAEIFVFPFYLGVVCQNYLILANNV